MILSEKPVIVKRSDGVGWGGNFPSPTLIPAGEVISCDVELPTKQDGKLIEFTAWSYLDFSLTLDLAYQTLRVRAVYTILDDAETKRDSIWTGKLCFPCWTTWCGRKRHFLHNRKTTTPEK